MQKSFQPSPGAQIVTFGLESFECLVVNLSMIDFVMRMVSVDDVYFDRALNRLHVSFNFPCTEAAIRSRLINAGYSVLDQETPVLVIEQRTVEEAAIPA